MPRHILASDTMQDPFAIFWAVLIFASIFWYGFLVLYIGIKAGRDILAMTASLKTEQPRQDTH